MAKLEISLSLIGSQETVVSPGISVPRSIEARGLWRMSSEKDKGSKTEKQKSS